MMRVDRIAMGFGDRVAQPILAVRDLRIVYAAKDRVVHAVRGLSLDIRQGEAVGLVGESGCGKSATALALLGLLPRPVGRVIGGRAIFDGMDLMALPEVSMRDIRGQRIAIVFQDPLSSLNPVMPIGRQIAEQLQHHRAVSRQAARKRTIELLSLVGIPEAERRMDEYPHRLSGGMRQRVMIAMALSCEPDLLIADEPTTALDVTIQAQVLELLDRLRSDLGMALLLITHDLGVVAGIADMLAVMYAGRIVESGPTATVLAAPRHPYTRALLASVPRLDHPRGERLRPIEGAPPDLGMPLDGCPFRPRCTHAIPRCLEEPELQPTNELHAAACWVLPSHPSETQQRSGIEMSAGDVQATG